MRVEAPDELGRVRIKGGCRRRFSQYCEPTVSLRIPVSVVPIVRDILEYAKSRAEYARSAIQLTDELERRDRCA